MNSRFKRVISSVIVLIFIVMVFWDPDQGSVAKAADPENDYSSILAMSLDFFDENACGNDVDSLGISWRGKCHTYDSGASLAKADNYPAQYSSVIDPDGDGTVDVSGGYHDAGDHVKFNLTMGFAGNSLALAAYLYPDAFEDAGAKEHLLKIAKRNADYLMKTTFLDDSGEVVAVCHVVGNGNTDHNDWDSPENQTYERITYWLTAQYNNTAVCCEMAGAIAGTAWLYKDTDAAYSKQCIKYARALLKFGKENQGNHLNGLSTFYDTAGYYGSETMYGLDETALAEAWLWLLNEGEKPVYEPNSGCYIYQGVYYGDYYFYSWDKVWQGFAALMYKKTGDAAYAQALKDAYDNQKGLSQDQYSTLGVTWGVSRYNCALQMTALMLAGGDADSAYAKASRFQMDYILGNNSYGYSFLIGYGNNPTHIHHRAANPSKGEAKYVLKGALLGGPDEKGYQDYVDSYQYTESALDYSGCFILACSGLAELYPSGNIPSDPTPEDKPTPEDTPTPTPSENVTPTPSANATPIAEATATPTPSANATPTAEATATPTPSANVTPAITVTPAVTPAGTPTPSPEQPADMIDAGAFVLAVKQKVNIAEIMKAKLGDESIRLVKFTSDKKKAASVNKKGIVTARKVTESVVITGYKKEGGKNIPVASISLDIVKPVIKFENDDHLRKDLTYAGEMIDLESCISVLPEGQAYRWEIPGKCKVASLDGSTLTAVKNGTVKVKCIIGEGKYTAKYSATVKVKIPKLAEVLNIKTGKTKTVSIKNVSKYTDVKWECSDGLNIQNTGDPRKVKISAGNAGEYELEAVIDEHTYIMHVNVQ
ncbi:MAG: glycoside hydrolase family 9 protein [Lachnospiraceae bacterium]|nr:glycoside hydrolase family 9 protein [Lachnospiraceae bacterium]